MSNKLIQLSQALETALANRRPVVALESTVIAHGLPRPLNLKLARRLQEIVSEAGAVPATIAIIDGQLRAGLNDQELEFIANSADIRKVSTRDLPLAVTARINGATTVATTSWIAHRAGIKVFATGGIGGVHRGTVPDISADLTELARTPIIVVCSGAKILLDLTATREWLETHGVTVLGYACNEFPAFYSRTSGLPVDGRVNSPAEVVDVFRGHQALNLATALLVTVPVPAEFEVPANQLENALGSALSEAEKNRITGRDLTPFLLTQMAVVSEGSTLNANVALLENNARVAAQIACAL